MNSQYIHRELENLCVTTSDHEWASISATIHRLNILRAERQGKWNHIITAISSNDAKELANYEYEQGQNDTMAYASYLMVLDQLRQFMLSLGAFTGTSDAKLNVEKKAALVDYLTILSGKLADAAAVYHGHLVRERPTVHTVQRVVQPAYIETFMEQHARIQDSISRVLAKPDSLKPIEEELLVSQLDRDFHKLISTMKKRSRGRDKISVKRYNRVKALMKEQNLSVEAAADIVAVKEGDLELSQNIQQAYYRILTDN